MVPKVVRFYREAPRTEDNALGRELAPTDSMAVCSRNEHAVFACGLVASSQLRSHGVTHGANILLRLTRSWLQKAKA